MKDIGPSNSWATSVNDKGEVCGSYVNERGENRYFIFDEKGFTDVGVTALESYHSFDNPFLHRDHSAHQQSGHDSRRL